MKKIVKPISSKLLLKLIVGCLEDNKAFNIVTINLIGRSSIGDYMVVANGNSSRQVTAMANNLIEELKEKGRTPHKPEGMINGDWVLIDAGDVLVHLFRPEVREFYSLEKMWSQKENIDIETNKNISK